MTNIRQEEFEELGWKHLGSQWYDLIDVPGELGFYNYVRLRKWGENSMIQAYRNDPHDFPDQQDEQDYLFQGNVENAKDLEKLMTQLHLM